jgi:hypothetical protein
MKPPVFKDLKPNGLKCELYVKSVNILNITFVRQI